MRLIFFVLLIFRARSKIIELEGTLEDRGYDIHTCDSKLCKDDGICVQANQKPNCLCFDQYAEGPNCESSVGYCTRDMGKCDPGNTKECIPLFGQDYCKCYTKIMDKKGASGRYCEKREYFEWSHWCDQPNLFFKRTVQPNEEQSVTVICTKLLEPDLPQDTSYQFVGLKLHGVPFNLKYSQFKVAEESVLKDTLIDDYKISESVVGSLDWDDLIYEQVKYVPQLPGFSTHKLYLTEVVANRVHHVDLVGVDAYIIADYDYMAYVEKKECNPSLRFSGGVCSRDFGSANTLISSRTYKITYVIQNNCHYQSSTGVEIDYRHFYQLDEIEGYYPKPINKEIDTGVTDTIQPTKKLGSDKFKVTDIARSGILLHSYGLMYFGVKSNSTNPLKAKDRCWIVMPGPDIPRPRIPGGNFLSFKSGVINIVGEIYYLNTFKNAGPKPPDRKMTIRWNCTSPAEGGDELCDGFISSCQSNKETGLTLKLNAALEGMSCISDVQLSVEYKNDDKTVSKYVTAIKIAVLGQSSGVIYKILCIRNCGDSSLLEEVSDYYLSGSQYVVTSDPLEFIYLRAQCEPQKLCSDAMYYWGLRIKGEQNLPDERFVFHGNNDTERIYLPGAFMDYSEWDLVVYLTAQKDNQNMYQSPQARFILRFDPPYIFDFQHASLKSWKNLDKLDVRINDMCPSEIKTSGRVLLTEFELCQPVPHVSELGLTFRYFQKVGLNYPVLIAWGQYSYIPNVLLAEGPETSVRTQLVYDFTGDELYLLHKQIEILPPKQRSGLHHMALLQHIFFNDGWKGRQNVAANFAHKEWSEITQKMHVITNEMLLNDVKGLEAELFMEIANMKHQIWAKFYELMNGVQLDEANEFIQLSTLLYEVVQTSMLPMDNFAAKSCSAAMAKVVEGLQTILEADKNYKEKPNRVVTLFRPVFKILAAVIYPAMTDLQKGQLDPITQSMFVKISDQLEVPWWQEPYKETFQDYNALDPLILNRTAEYKEASDISVETIKKLSRILVTFLQPIDDKAVFPPLHVSQTSSEEPMFLLYLQCAKPRFFDKGQELNVGVDSDIFVKFQKPLAAAATDNVFFEFILSPHNPYWFEPSANNMADLAFRIIASSTKSHSSMNREDSPKTTVMKPMNESVSITFRTEDMVGNLKRYVRGMAFRLESEDDAESALSIQIAAISNRTARYIVIEFNNTLEDTLRVVASLGQKPTVSDFRFKSSVMKVSSLNNIVIKELPDSDTQTESALYVAVMPNGFYPVPYEMTIFAVECDEWDNMTHSWKSACKGLRVTKSRFSCTCYTNENKLYGFKIEVLPSQNFGWMKLSIDAQIAVSYIIIFTVTMLIIIMGALMFIGAMMDEDDNKKKVAQFLVDNRPNETYPYVIVIGTGHGFSSATTANRGIRVYGTRQNTKRHILRGVEYHPKMPKSRNVEWFVLTVTQPIGQIRCVELWSDYRGYSPDWYCDKVIVRDYQDMIEWVFVVNKWFSVIMGEQKTHYFLFQKKKHAPFVGDQFYMMEDLFQHHCWVGMFIRSYCNSFSRKQKICLCLSIMMIGMTVIMFWFGVVYVDDYAQADFGAFRFDPCFPAAYFGLFISLLINYPLMYCFKNARPTPNWNPDFIDLSGLDPTARIPYYRIGYTTKLCAWAVMISLLLLCVFLLCYYGYDYGSRKSAMWFVATIIMFFLDILFVEPIHVLVRNMVWRSMMQMDDTPHFCNELVDFDYSDQIEFSKQVNKQRIISRDMAFNLPIRFEKILLDRELIYHEYRRLFLDSINYLLYMIAALLILEFSSDRGSYYSSKVIKDIFVDSQYTRSMTLYDITDHQTLLQYLNSTILVAMHWRNPCWLVSGDRKLIGVARLRQLRVARGFCFVHSSMASLTTKICENDLGDYFRDMRFYNEEWSPYNQSRMERRFIMPFRYQVEPFVQSVSAYGYLGRLPNDGYVGFLGRTLINTRFALNNLVKLKWFDELTRVIILEFNAYSADINLFNFVQLIVERSANGVNHISHQITTLKLIQDNWWEILLSIFACLVILIAQILLIYTAYVEIKRIGLGTYCKNLLNFTDIIFFILSLQFIYYLVSSVDNTAESIRVMDNTPSNWYVGFGDVVSARYALKVSGGYLTFSGMCRLLMFLYYVPQARMVFLTMKLASGPFINLGLIIILLSCVSSSLLYINLSYSLTYSESWVTSFVTFFLLPFGWRPQIDREYLNNAGNIAYILYVMTFITLRVLINSLVVMILLRNFRRAHRQVQRRSLGYTIPDYFKQRIMKHPNDFECYRKWYDNYRRRRRRLMGVKRDVSKEPVMEVEETGRKEHSLQTRQRRYKFDWCWFL